MKRKVKIIDMKSLITVILSLVISVTMLIYSYTYRKPADAENTEVYETIIRNVEYQSGDWLSFSSDIGECYIDPRNVLVRDLTDS